MTKEHLFEVNLEQYRAGLIRAGQNVEADRNAVARSVAVQKERALAAIAAGMSEREVHRLAGVSIPTLRKWQGKK